MTAGDDLEARLLAVADRYEEPHRRYHTTRHLISVLAEVDRLLAEVEVPGSEAVRLAALFHDAVYDPRSTTNEADSAVLAREVLEGLMSADVVAAVERLVLATAEHHPLAVDEAVLLDADLAILASDPDPYAAYVAAVRAEYAHVDDAAWKAGRAAVLRSFLDRDHIFHTEPMLDREMTARRNMQQELTELER